MTAARAAKARSRSTLSRLWSIPGFLASLGATLSNPVKRSFMPYTFVALRLCPSQRLQPANQHGDLWGVRRGCQLLWLLMALVPWHQPLVSSRVPRLMIEDIARPADVDPVSTRRTAREMLRFALHGRVCHCCVVAETLLRHMPKISGRKANPLILRQPAVQRSVSGAASGCCSELNSDSNCPPSAVELKCLVNRRPSSHPWQRSSGCHPVAA